jgi:hypothetical protein
VSVGAGSTGRWFSSGCSGRAWRSDRLGQVERGGQAGVQVVRPGPGVGDADLPQALSADQAGAGVQEPVAQGLGFGLGQVPGQAEQPEPGQQVAGDRDGEVPGLVDLER